MKQVVTGSNRGTRSLCITYSCGEFLRVGNDQRGHQHIPGVLDGGNIELGKNIAAFDGIALGDPGGKVLAVQLDGIHTDVHEQIQPVFGAHAVGVTGGKCHSNLTVGGRHKVFLVIYK